MHASELDFEKQLHLVVSISIIIKSLILRIREFEDSKGCSALWNPQFLDPSIIAINPMLRTAMQDGDDPLWCWVTLHLSLLHFRCCL